MLLPFDKDAVKDGAPVILYGAAMYGDLALNALKNLEIPVFAFCDRVQAGKRFRGLDILSPEQLRDYPNAHILVCATKGLEGISYYLEKIRHKRGYEISGLLPYTRYDSLPDYCRALPIEELIEKYRFFLPGEYTEKPVKDNSETFHLSFVAMSITERCTLRCAKCSVLSPYYNHPGDDPYESIITSFGRFLDCIDSIADLQIGGGETFLHKDLGKILTYCLAQEKVKEVSIFTNSTIFPNAELRLILKNPKIKLLLDDYGDLSRKLQDLISFCDEEHIRYVLQKFERWDDLGDYRDKGETEESVTEKFRLCSFGKDVSFMKGKLYCCPTAHRIADLGLVPDNPSDYVDFNHDGDISEWKRQISDLLYHKKYHDGCRLCNGISPYRLGIPVAEQLTGKAML